MELEKPRPSLNMTLALLGVSGFPQEITRKPEKHIIPQNKGRWHAGGLRTAQSANCVLYKDPVIEMSLVLLLCLIISPSEGKVRSE